jgi:hypothetical protein
MIIPLYTFLSIIALIIGGALWFFRGAIFAVSTAAAEHAKVYAVAYVKGGALVSIAMLSSFDETFRNLTRDTAATLPWWGWAVLFFKPLSAALAVLAAFLDRSITRAKEERAATTPPYTQPVIPPNS